MRTYFFALIAIGLLICSCKSQHTATRKLLKAQIRHPEVVAKFCSALYPPIDFLKDSIIYKQGERELVFVHVDCDSITKSLPGIKKVKIPCPSQTVPDTYFVYKEKHLVNKAEVTYLQHVSDECRVENEVVKSRNKLLIQVLLILFIYTLLRWVLRIWNITLP